MSDDLNKKEKLKEKGRGLALGLLGGRDDALESALDAQ